MYSFFRARRAAPIARILIIKWSALGDAAIASAAMEDVYRAFPHATLHLNTLPGAARLFREDPRFERLLVVDVRARKHRWRNHLTWLREVRRGCYDAVFDLQGSDHTRLLLAALWLSGHRVPTRIGLRGGFPFTAKPHVRSRGVHALLQAQSALQAGGIVTSQMSPVLHAGNIDRAEAEAALQREGLTSARFALLLPGSQAGGWLKRWSTWRYAELALALLNSGEAERIAVLGGPEEVGECRDIVAWVNARRPGTSVHLDRLPLAQIPTIAKAARCIVANDTGTAHIAAAAPTPMLVLCGPTDPRRVKPMGLHVHAVQSTGACQACYRKTCAHGKGPLCLQAIDPQALLPLLRDPTASVAGLRVVGDAQVAGAKAGVC